MLLTPALALAAAVRVVVPVFQVENLPPFVAAKMSKLVAAELDRAGCAAASAEPGLSESARHDLDGCYGQPSCLASIGAHLGAQKLVLGTVRRDASTYSVRMLVVDVAKRRVQRGVTDKLTARPDLLPLVARRAAKPLCDIFLGGDELPLEEVHLETTPPPEFGALPALPDDIDLDLDVPSAKTLAKNEAIAPTIAPTIAPPQIAPPQIAPPQIAPTISPPELATAAPMPPPPVPKVELIAPPPDALPPLPQLTETPPPPPPPMPRAEPPPMVLVTPPAPVSPPPRLEPPPTPPAPPPKPVPAPGWNRFVLGGGVVAFAGGSALGVASALLASGDRVGRNADGVTHSITRATAMRANSYAASANVLFGVGVAAGLVGGVVLVLSDHGVALGGKF